LSSNSISHAMSDPKTPGQASPVPSFDNEMAEILESFLVETREILDHLGQDLLTLERGTADPELLNSIFRAVHTVKGTSSFLGLEQMTSLAHTFEDVLNKLRKGELTVTPEKMDVMFEAYDLMKELLVRIEQHNSQPVELTGIQGKLKIIGQGGMPEGADSSPKPGGAAVTPVPAPEPASSPAQDPVSAPPAVQGEAPAPSASAKPQRDARPEAASQNAAAAQGKGADTTIRVDVGRLDSLMNLVGELVLGRNRLSQISAQTTRDHEDLGITKGLAETSSQIDFITTELQMAVMKTRMVPIAKVFNKLPRLVRDLTRETGKEIDLQITGEETELDKTIIEELNDPLVHLLRNACDHGIEMPEERKAAGKNPLGVVRVTAEHEGNHIVISICDDGHGMDPAKLKAKGIEKGLITEAQARDMSAREAFNLVFAPGFSTAAKVTNISGRGVGMDVVRTNIAKLKGIVEIDSELGNGSTFTIKLPLTLAIIQALLVEADKETYCVPLTSVLEVVRVRADEVKTINGQPVVRLRNSVLPIIRIADVMGLPMLDGQQEWTYIVVVGIAEKRMGIVVDLLLGQKEVVIKPLGSYLGTIRGIAGSTILGDGQVIMIVDVGELMALTAAERDSVHQGVS
jgi:two-component system, chemotaxis family, sensor kinase CheA